MTEIVQATTTNDQAALLVAHGRRRWLVGDAGTAEPGPQPPFCDVNSSLPTFDFWLVPL